MVSDDNDNYSGEEDNFQVELVGNIKEVSVGCIATHPNQMLLPGSPT